MNKIKLSVIVLLCSLNVLFAQESNEKVKAYKVWVSKTDNSKVIKGILFEANDESLRIIGKKSSEIIVKIKDIHKLKVRRKGKVGRGAGIGAGIGAATGALIGLVSGDDPDKTVEIWGSVTWTVEGATAGEKAAGWAILLGTAGTVVGAVVGSKKEAFLINGDSKNYLMYFDKIQTYSMNRKK
jgi:hypothetical protein